ncbi:MAG: hypothetical protein AB7P76_04970 [Candidatus Melainabacteria bacterium]
MGFDGIPSFRRVDHLNPYAAEQAAKSDNIHRPKIGKPESDEGVHEAPKHLAGDPDDDENKHAPLTDQELEEVLRFARLRGILSLSFETGALYEFQLNPERGTVDLVKQDSGQVVLSFAPSELHELMQKLDRYAGFLSDRAG